MLAFVVVLLYHRFLSLFGVMTAFLFCLYVFIVFVFFFFFQAEDGIRDTSVTGVQTCALPISLARAVAAADRGAHERRARPPRDLRLRGRGSRPVRTLGCGGADGRPRRRRSEERRVGKEWRSRWVP